MSFQQTRAETGTDQQRPFSQPAHLSNSNPMSIRESSELCPKPIKANPAKLIPQPKTLKLSKSEEDDLKITSKEDLDKIKNQRIKTRIRDLTFPNNPNLFGDVL